MLSMRKQWRKALRTLETFKLETKEYDKPTNTVTKRQKIYKNIFLNNVYSGIVASSRFLFVCLLSCVNAVGLFNIVKVIPQRSVHFNVPRFPNISPFTDSSLTWASCEGQLYQS